MSVSSISKPISFDPTNIDDPVNPGVKDITRSKKSSWGIPRIGKLFTGALAIQSAAMAPRAEAGPLAYYVCIAACLPLMEAPPLFAACLAVCAPTLAAPTP